MRAGHHQCRQQRGWDIDTFSNFINPGQVGWGEGGEHVPLQMLFWASCSAIIWLAGGSRTRPFFRVQGSSATCPLTCRPFFPVAKRFPALLPFQDDWGGIAGPLGQVPACGHIWRKRDLPVGATASEERLWGSCPGHYFLKQQHRIKIAGRSINNLRYTDTQMTDDTTLMAENEE